MNASTRAALDYIRSYYRVPAEIGGHVRYTWKGNRPGVITGTQGAYLMIQLDGEPQPMPFHPTWELKYVFPAPGCERCGHGRNQHANGGCYGSSGEGCATCTPALAQLAVRS